jgi:hypothetical protein
MHPLWMVVVVLYHVSIWLQKTIYHHEDDVAMKLDNESSNQVWRTPSSDGI